MLKIKVSKEAGQELERAANAVGRPVTAVTLPEVPVNLFSPRNNAGCATHTTGDAVIIRCGGSIN